MRKQEIFIVIITIFVLILTTKRPFWGVNYFYLYYALMYNKLFLAFRSLRPLFVIPLVAFLSLIFINKKKLEFSPQLVLIGLLFLWMCISRLVNNYNVLDGEEIVPFIKILFFLFLLTNVFDTKEKFKLFIWLMIIVYADLSYVARYNDVTAPYYLNKNLFGFSLVGAVAFPAMIALSEKRVLRKAEALCYMLLIVFAIAGTDSRGSYVGLGIIFILLACSNLSIKRLPLLLVPILFILSRVSMIHWDRLFSINTDIEQAGTAGQRIASWSVGIRMMLTNPFFGVGSGESGPQYWNYATFAEGEKTGGMVGAGMKMHNMIVQIGAEMGVVGLGIFTLVLLISFLHLWQMRRLCKQNDKLIDLKPLIYGLGISIIGAFATGQFGNRGYNLQFYSLICLVFCLKRIIEKEHKRILEGRHVAEEVIIPEKREVFFRTAIFLTFTYMSLFN